MAKTQHTPGPWSASLDMDGRHHHLAIMTENEAFKEEKWPYHPKIAGVYHGLWNAPRDIAKANARLIAAAPELLEACQYALKHLSSDDKYLKDDALWSCVSHFVRAIEKAGGVL